MAHVNKRHPKAAAALSGKVETKAEERRENPGKTNSSNPGKTNSIQLSIPGKANSIQLSIPGKANSIKLRVPSKERGNGNRVSSHGWHTSVVCPQCDYNPTSETDLKNHVQIAHVLNHEERVATNDGVEHSSEAASEAAVTATPQGLSTVSEVVILQHCLSFPLFFLVHTELCKFVGKCGVAQMAALWRHNVWPLSGIFSSAALAGM